MSLPLSRWDDKKKCSKKGCELFAEQVLLPPDRLQRKCGIVPVVVHVDAAGNYRFPGHKEAEAPRGFHKVELRTIPELEKFEREVNRKLSNEAERHNDREEKIFKEAQERNRSDLRAAMQHFSEQGRAFAQFAMEHNNKRTRKKSDVGFHLEVLHYDSSNRPEYCDKETGWKRKVF